MKKVFTVLCFSMVFFAAQNVSAQAEIDKGNVLLNAGLGFGRFFGGGVPVMLSAEFAINDAISVGPYFGFTSWKYSSYWSYTFIDFGAKGAYHFSKHLNLNTDKLDLYGAAILGYTVSSYKYDGPGGFGRYNDNYGDGVRFGIIGGARWYFSERFAVNGEVGYGLAPLHLGITYKL